MKIRLALLVASGLPFFGRIIVATGSPDTTWINYLLNGGPFAVVVFLLISDKITTPGERNRLRDELSSSHLREDKLNENIRHDIVPLMTNVNNTLGRVITELGNLERYPRKE